MAQSHKISLAFLMVWLLLVVLPGFAAAQNISIDGRFSPAQTLVGPNYAITANLGRQVGSNLFHSFGKFGLSISERAAFSGPATINNVIGRVTGGNPSSIDGKIKSNIAGANLYLINPSGIVFGPTATVDVKGSFHASTADYLKMSDGARFQATNPDASTLSAAPPAAFGFMTTRPAAITVNGSTLGPVPGTLGVVAGPVSITGATLSAPAGTIHVASVAGTGEVPVDPRNTPALTVTSFGAVDIKGGSTLDVSDPKNLGSGGSVFIRAGGLTIDASEINGDNYGSGSGSVLSLRGDDQTTLGNSAYVHAVTMDGGSGADVMISTAPAGVITADNSTVLTGSVGSGNAGPLAVTTGQLTLTNGAGFNSLAQGDGNGGDISVTAAGSLLIDANAPVDPNTGFFSPIGIFSDASGAGRGGSITIVAGQLTLHNGAAVFAQSEGAGAGGGVSVSVGRSIIVNSGATLGTLAEGPGQAGNVSVTAAGPVTVDMSTGFVNSILLGIGSVTGLLGPNTGNAGNATVTADAMTINNSGLVSSLTFGAGNSGRLSVTAGNLSILNDGLIGVGAFGSGDPGSVSVSVTGRLSIDGSNQVFGTGILSDTGIVKGLPVHGTPGNITVTAGDLSIVNNGSISASTFGTSDGGSTSVTAGTLSIVNSGVISAATFGSGNGGSVSINVARQLTIDGTSGGPTIAAGITSQSFPGSFGNAGSVSVSAGTLSIINNGVISAATFGPGSGGSVTVGVAGGMSIDGTGADARFLTGISSQANAGSTGNAGSVSVTAGSLVIASGGSISTNANGSGAGGSVSVTTPGMLLLDGRGVGNTQIAASATGSQSGPGGSVTIGADTLMVAGGAQIASTTAGSGKGGDIDVAVANSVTLSGQGPNGASGITASAEPGSSGQAGEVRLAAGGAIALSGGASVTTSTAGAGKGGTVQVIAGDPLTLSDPGSGITASATSIASGNAGSVNATAPQITITTGGQIASTTAGSGAGGSVEVMTPGVLVLAGTGVANTQIAASAVGQQSGPGGSVTVVADTLMVAGGAQIASSTAGPGKGGDVTVTVGNGVVLSGQEPNGGSGTTASAQPGSSGQAGEVMLTAGGAIALSSGAVVTSSTAGSGNGGTVRITAQGPLTLSDPGTGITASATSTASGNAGSAQVTAPQITIARGAAVASTTAGTGIGGSVNVTTPGALVLDGAGVANTQIAASAIGPQSGPGGSVTVAGNALTIEGGAQIASSTAGPGRGGDVNVRVAADIVLPDPGPQITARSTGSGDAGSITVSAVRLLLNKGAGISTEAETSTASGGNITLHVRDFLYLVSSEINASVRGETGNGGNITIDPQLVILNHSSIRADAIEGHGGNIIINASEFIASSDSIVAATGELAFSGPRVDVNGALVVLSTQLRSAAEVLRHSCAVQGGRPQSSFVEAGRGGLPQDPEATLPALYIAGRDLSPTPQPAEESDAAGGALRTTVNLRMRCG